ncbi:protein spire isoform X4 [Microplitis mediator]|uniref:protein spire isoform X4 n=1 Tax=Microplitis mediator TaxID=375433 RepID=UPI0025540195|nr:protein spire isoform X4 [Microplitis mediator]
MSEKLKKNMDKPIPKPRTRRLNCRLNCDDTLNLEDTLLSFNGPIGQEQAWAVCHQTAKCLAALGPNKLQELTRLTQILLHKEGYVLLDLPTDSHAMHSSERKVVFSLGVLIFKALDFRLDQKEERRLSLDLKDLINLMTSCDEEYEPEERHETDDEGIGRDSEAEMDEPHENGSYISNPDYYSLKNIIQVCVKHVQGTEEQADVHYRAVIRAFVHEALELTQFLEKVAVERFHDSPTNFSKHSEPKHAVASCQQLDTLGYDDWTDIRIWRAIQARFWVQVIGELRRGIKLKKVEENLGKRGRAHSKGRGTEFELTPYEILMNDIRERRYNLKKTPAPSPRVTKDARAVVLEFIRSRPPLKKASERQLPPRRKQSTMRELLMESIKKPPRPLRSCRERQLNEKKGEVPPAQAEQVQEQEPAQDVAAQWRHSEGQGSHPVPKPRQRLSKPAETKARNRKCRRRIRASDDGQEAVESETGDQAVKKQQRKLIPVDFKLDIEEDDEDDDDEDDEYAVTRFEDEDEPADNDNEMYQKSKWFGGRPHVGGDIEDDDDKSSANPWRKTGKLRLTQNEYHRFCDAQLESYDLATQCPSRRASARKHTGRCSTKPLIAFSGTCSVPHSRPQSRQHAGVMGNDMRMSLNPSPNVSPSISPRARERILMKSHTTVESDNKHHTNQSDSDRKPSLGDMFLDERLSLTLEEIVHIRSVLTKAELESLPVEGRVKEDVEKRRVCFLCLKTRFGILGPWGQRCRLCERTVCVKCYSKMRIPTEHFAHVPVVLLSPGLLLSPSNSEPDSTRNPWPRPGGAVGSAPASPAHRRRDPALNNGTPLSTPNPATPADNLTPGSTPTSLGRRDDLLDRSRYPKVGGSPSRMSNSAIGSLGPGIGSEPLVAERLRGVSMVVCHDCRIMVIQIIKSSRSTRATIRNNVISRLTLNLSPAYV